MIRTAYAYSIRKVSRLLGTTHPHGCCSISTTVISSSSSGFYCSNNNSTTRNLFRSSNTTSTSSFSSSAAAAVTDTSSSGRKYKYFRNVEITPDGVAVIRFDGPKSVNTLNFEMGNETKVLWKDEIVDNKNVKAVVFLSAKPDGFIAGADISDIKNTPNKADFIPHIEDTLNMFQSMKAKGVPLVCGVHGPALGGGLEWALWCDYRICSDSSKTKMGLPEVKLGLLPGFGGTQNLHPLVGLQAAMDMMLTGKDIRPAKAKKMGLVDEVVAPQSVESRAIDAALELSKKTLKSKKKKKSFMQWAIEDTSLGRSLMWKEVDKQVAKNTDGNYPAPYAIIECVKYGLDKTGTQRYNMEREKFAALAATSESEALIGIFEGMTSLKKHEFGTPPTKVAKVTVLGAGLMGAGIAQVTAEKGYEVLLKDRDDAGVARGEKYIRENWEKKFNRKQMTQYQFNTNMCNITPLTDATASWHKHVASSDLVIEAVFEDLTLKRKIVKQFEEIISENCVFATNTSAIPISAIALEAKRPEMIIGMHYFSPVPSMPLLEIIPHAGTCAKAKAIACEVGAKQGKTCIVVKDVPGFYVNRCLGPFLIEVSALVKDGIGLEVLDDAMKKFGMPVGPITLADEVGVDIAYHVASFLSKADLGVRMTGGDVTLMGKMVEKGWLGKKSGQGFYTYDKKKKTINSEIKAYVKGFATQELKLSQEEIQNRIVARFVNEAVKCLEDEIIADPVAGHIGLVFGTGFAPFRGGPFRYLDTVGVSSYVDMMNKLTDMYGPQFEPCAMLKDYASSGKKFHGN